VARSVRTYSTDNLPSNAVWKTFRKTSLTNATRIAGPFAVETSEGVLTCEDGWLAIDARGYPYPIANEEFKMIYEPFDSASG
jgi:hypothetical protein